MIKIAFSEYLIGKLERMTWIVETSYGSGGTMTSGEIIGTNCSIEPDFSQGFQEYLTSGASTRTVQGRVKGPLLLPYTMNFNPVNWRWLKYLMSCANGDDSGVKTHTFTVNNSILSYKLEWAKRHTTAHVVTLTGNVMQSATISFARATGEGMEGHIVVNATCVAQNIAQGSSVSSVSNLSKDPFNFRHIVLNIDGSEVAEVNNGEMTIDQGVDENDSRYCNATYDNTLGEPIPKIFRVSGRFNLNIKDKTYYDLWVAGTAVSGACSLVVMRDADTDDMITFTFTNFYVLGGVAPTNLEGVTNVDIVWSADSFSSVVARDDITTY